MTPADFRIFNRLAVEMNGYHNMLCGTWNELYGTSPLFSTIPAENKDPH